MELTELKDRIVATFSGTKNDLANVLAMAEQDQLKDLLLEGGGVFLFWHDRK